MIRRHTAGLALVPLVLALAACKPAQEAAPTPAVETPEAAPATSAQSAALAGTDATAVVHNPPADPAGFDRKAFAGSFAGTVPCADCPGIDTSVQISDDGSFRLTETYQQRDTRHETTGTWTVDASGTKLQLDPDTKDSADRWFAIVSNDEIRLLDTEGKPIESTHNHSLRRN